MKSIYISGPVTGRPWASAVEHFTANERMIRAAARENKIEITIRNPVSFCLPSYGWHWAMRNCVRELSYSGGIALLQGWQKSKGAAIELRLAQELCIPVVYVEPPVRDADFAALIAAAPEAGRYYEERLARHQQEGTEAGPAEERALAELANRYLDPYGFEYREHSREE